MGKKKELKLETYVREMLSEDEELIRMKTKYVVYNDDNFDGVLAITNKRVIFHNDSLFKGKVTVEYPFNKIITIEQDKDEIKLIGSGIKAEFKMFSLSDIEEMAQALREQLEKFNSHDKESSNNAKTDFISQLERLAELKKQGILTEEEFQDQKKRILEY